MRDYVLEVNKQTNKIYTKFKQQLNSEGPKDFLPHDITAV